MTLYFTGVRQPNFSWVKNLKGGSLCRIWISNETINLKKVYTDMYSEVGKGKGDTQ